jgi:glycosyltransferase involved in cell wall biosynthesis
MNEINYIAEIKLPSSSAYVQHVLKMCDAFSQNAKVNLYIYQNDIKFSHLKKKYLLKNNFKIIPFKKKISKINFFFRFTFSLWVKKKIKNKISFIFSRSILSSLVLSVFKIKNVLEFHHLPQGLTGIIYSFLKRYKLDNKIKYVVISKKLKKDLKLTNAIVLDDAVDINDFKNLGKTKLMYEFVYIGSLFEGKGIEIINYLSKIFYKKKFYIFGDLKTLSSKYKYLLKRKNLIFKKYVDYNKIPKILYSSKFLLMPYFKSVKVNSKTLKVEKYMSPLKMFDYLASGKIIIASNLKVYSHILKNNFNCILVNNEKLSNWSKTLRNLYKFNKDFQHIVINAKNTAEKHTWNKRSIKMINFIKNENIQ